MITGLVQIFKGGLNGVRNYVNDVKKGKTINQSDEENDTVPVFLLQRAVKVSKKLKDGVNFWSYRWNTSSDIGWTLVWDMASLKALPSIHINFHRLMSFCKVSFDLTFIGALKNGNFTPKVTL